MKEIILSESTIKDKIFTIRGVQVMLDRDLANLYDVEIRRLNEQVKRNEERFPDNFMFQLTPEEYKWMVSQNAIPSKDPLRSQNATLENNRGKHRKYLPYVFTEQGISMLSGVLRSKTAIQVSIKIINAFVAMRKFISKNAEIFYRIDNVERKQLEFELKTEQNFEKVFNAMQNEKPKQGIFYDGQVFEAYKFVCELVRTAKKEILANMKPSKR